MYVFRLEIGHHKKKVFCGVYMCAHVHGGMCAHVTCIHCVMSYNVEGQNWMAPSMQSVDSSSYGSVDQSMSTSSSPGSTFLFKVPTSRPRRQVGPDFGTERLRLDGADGEVHIFLMPLMLL